MENKKKVLVTAGATMVPIDQVRGVTNIFKGRTGAMIAEWFYSQGYDVTLVTSNSDLVEKYREAYVESGGWTRGFKPWFVRTFKTFDDLTGGYDLIIHSAAVSDYKVSRVLIGEAESGLIPIDSTAKISSSHSKVYLEMTPTIKLIDQFRKWGFKGMLVKFKLQVGLTDTELLEIAQRSLQESDADLIVANCLEWSKERAYVVSRFGKTRSVERYSIASSIDNFFKRREL
ncbi:MAG: bifunctional phosphopantothenoylcysteine decarboxylase/phosphopantothenate synthase [Candidatus Magasanikbacteria bacterium]|nr:bifunctional phosphopantothenoylcysteine decarboxylase/phosphopantothenate synthase [Candidatus Magasanikbacteria bacterium]